MKTVAIISEYNPFHNGHAYHIQKIREEFGDDTAIIAIMSGNLTQRGEFACMTKGDRAKCAILGGVNLVLELPFPFSSSSAEFFASSGVKIAEMLGIVDYLSFGSECGDITELKKAAEIISSDLYFEKLASLNDDKSLGYPEKCEIAFRSIYPESEITLTPNNILAIEYIKALNNQKSSIIPHTVKRCGSDYNETQISNKQNQSAMAIRNEMTRDPYISLDYIPSTSKNTFLSAIQSGDMPTDINALSVAVISYFRLNPPKATDDIHDATDGLYNRLYNASFKANDISSLLELTETKKFTTARIRRAMWNSFFGVTSSDVRTLPLFTQVLAMDNVGMLLLKNSRKSDEFSILTKPSSFEHFSSMQLRQKELADKADSIFELSKPVPKSGKSALTFTPYIKKS